jgi:hypothetical protein
MGSELAQIQDNNLMAIMAKANNGGKRGKRIKEITVTRVNEFPHKLYEQTLVDIYYQKIKNGTLRLQ